MALLAAVAILALYAVPSRACSPLQCEDPAANKCGPKAHSQWDDGKKASSAWHVMVQSSSECIVNSTEANLPTAAATTTYHAYLDVKVINNIYEDDDSVSVSAGDIIRLDYGVYTVTDCEGVMELSSDFENIGPGIEQCYNSCGPSTRVFNYYFEEGAEYLLYTDPAPTGSTVCGQPAPLLVASTQDCDNNIMNPSPEDVAALKEACGGDVDMAPKEASPPRSTAPEPVAQVTVSPEGDEGTAPTPMGGGGAEPPSGGAPDEGGEGEGESGTSGEGTVAGSTGSTERSANVTEPISGERGILRNGAMLVSVSAAVFAAMCAV